MSNDKKDEEMICALTADERLCLQKGLRELPDTMPPHDVWHKIRAQAKAEGLLTSPMRRNHWALGFGMAAAALTAVVIMTTQQSADVPASTVVPVVTNVEPPALSDLNALMVESRQLEDDLRSLPAEPRVSRAGTVATIADLEDRIAAIDYQLNDPRENLSPEDREIFWRERVRMMKLLLQLRYAQAQRAAY